MFKRVVMLSILLLSAGCKIEISAPEGGVVNSTSGNYGCPTEDVCIIEVTDTSFNEVFTAEPDESWVFVGWKSAPKHFCGDSLQNCRLSTINFGKYENLMEILESDDIFYLEPKFEKGVPIRDVISQVKDSALRQCLDEKQSVTYSQQVSAINCDYNVYGKIQSLEGIQHFPLLEIIRLFNHDIADLEPIANLVHLREIKMSRNKVSDLSAIKNLTKLEELGLGSNQVRVIPPLAKHTKLQNIFLSQNQITNLTPFRNTRPFQLFLGANQIKNVRPLASLKPSLWGFDGGINLELGYNGLTDLTGLAKIKHLSRRQSSLQLQGNGLTGKHLEKLKGLEVNRLYIFGNNIFSLSSLRGVKIKNELDVSDNKLTNLSGLSGKSLYSLYASSNNISDISALANMASIPYLNLSDNRIRNLSPLKIHYPHDSMYLPEFAPSYEWPAYSLDLDDNIISEVHDYLDGIHRGDVYLRDNPLLCSEVNRLENKTGEYNNYRVSYYLPANCVAK